MQRAILFLGSALIFWGTMSSAFALRPLQEEMKRLLNTVALPRALASKGVEDPRNVTDEHLDTAITRLGEALPIIDRARNLPVPAASDVAAADHAAFLTAYRARLQGLRTLLEALRVNYMELRTLPLEQRVYQRALVLVNQINACKDQSHTDFFSPTPLPNMHGNVCDMPQ